MIRKVERSSLRGGIEGLLRRLKDPEPALRDISKLLKESTEKRITSTKRAPDGAPWAPWAPGTEAARNKKGNASRGLLYDSGELLRSITARVENGQAIVGTGVSYAPFLQQGTNKMPARPFVGVSAEDQRDIQGILRRYLAEQVFRPR